MVKYLGELYNFRVIDSSIIFKTLYTILCYAIDYDTTKQNELDPMDNYFRLRLICTLLETCGQYFDRGNSKKKLDCFLTYFQRYFHFKKELLGVDCDKLFPLDVEYVYKDTIQMLRPSFKFTKNYTQACEVVNEMEKEIRENLNKVLPLESNPTGSLDAIEEKPNEEEEEIEYDDEYKDDYDENYEDEYAPKQRRSLSYDQQNQSSDEQTDNSNEGINETNDQIRVVQSRTNNKIVQQEDDEFEKAFDMMVAETISQRAKETMKAPNVDIALPMNLKNKLLYDEDYQNTNKEEKLSNEKFKFVFMTKKGNKPQFHKLDVPLTSQFANQFKAREEAEKLEKEKLKQLTLNINQRMEQEELQEMIQSMNQTFTGKHQSQSTYNNNNSNNSNRERKPKYNHPKGAPDASALDMIFGSSSINSSNK